MAICVVIAIALSGASLSIGAEPPTVEGMLKDKALVGAYNPVLLDYLLEEGRSVLPEAERKQAVDQLVSALKQDIEITPEEQRAAAMAAAGAGLAQLFGGNDTSDLGDTAQGATYQIWKGWVDSAFTLQRAGYGQQATAFFQKCIEVFPYSDLRGRCAIGLALSNPSEAYQRLLALTEGNDNDTIKAVLPLLGRLAGADGFPDALKGQAVARLEVFTKGLKKATFGVAACRGLVASGDQRAVPVLERLSKGMMNTDFFRCSRRGLLLDFGDKSVVPLLEKQLKGGMFSTSEPRDRLFAASLLMQAGEKSGFAFAAKELGKKKKKGFGKLLSSSKDDVDLRPALVTALVRAGGDQAIRVLKGPIPAAKPGSWLETWVAVGLLELGDTSRIQLAKAALGRSEWGFTAVRIATALAKHGDYSGVPALARVYQDAARGVEPDTARAALAFLAGEGDSYQSNKRAKRARLIRLRRQIAGGLADIDRPQCVPVLEAMLGDSEPSVRVSAAYALARMNVPDAVRGLQKAMTVDFGAAHDRSRNPLVYAHLVRTTAAHFASAEGAAGVTQTGLASPFASVRFLSLCEEQHTAAKEPVGG